MSDKSSATNLLPSLVLGGSLFCVGALLSFGYLQWTAQQQQLATLTQMVNQMQQAEQETVTRAETDFLAVPPAAALLPAPAPEPAAAPVLALSTSDQIRALETAVAAAAAQPPDAMVQSAQRMETLAIIDAGIQELVAAVVAGDYDIHTNYEDEHFSGRIHFAFVSAEQDQTELEQFIAAAAEAGILAHGPSVVDSDGSVNGHIMLFDLVERALENGTLEEQQAGQRMQQQAVALLAADVEVGEAPNAAGDRYYTVEAGDSLAYIALQFYGNTNDFHRIFDANRDILSSPERIDVGQRLLIPQA